MVASILLNSLGMSYGTVGNMRGLDHFANLKLKESLWVMTQDKGGVLLFASISEAHGMSVGVYATGLGWGLIILFINLT